LPPQKAECSEVPLRAIDSAAEDHRAIYASGEYEIDVSRRELRVLGSPVPLGGRAFEVLSILAQSAGELVTKAELMGRIWPGAIVMDATLHVHAAAVRKALGSRRGLLKTEAGRGYRLLGDWTVRRHAAVKPLAAPLQMRSTGEAPPTNFPAVVTSLVGRSAAVQRLHDLISAYRVVTLTGPGGIGKTTLALQVARRVLGGFAEGGWLVDLASLTDPRLVPSGVAGVLGLRQGSNINSAEAVARAIGGKRLLLVLDNCEHVIDAVATMVEMLVRLCPRATILATSRELFRIDGEYAYRVPPLEVPAKGQTRIDQVLNHSAPKLFVARANELGSDFSLRPQSVTTIAEICRQLDGIPLAIEFAAARAATLGVEQVAAGLRDRFATFASARRGALPRHRTLRATLDWSYDLLTDAERRLLRRLAIFSGSFPLMAVDAVINRDDALAAEIADRIANLVAKSLVSSDLSANRSYFRLLETTRVYALSRLAESGELQEYARRHAEYYKGLFERIENEWEKKSIPDAHVDNVRAALEWCFGVNGDLAIGVGLAAVAAPVFLAMSQLAECHRWSEQALLALDDATRGGSEELSLQTSLGVSLMQVHGQSDAAYAALSRGLMIAQERGDVLNQVGLLGMLSMFDVRDGNFKRSLDYARLSRTVDGTVKNPAAMALANSILGRALQFVGEHGESRLELEASFHYWSQSQRTSEVYLGLDHHILVGIGLARNLWLRGYPAQALERVRQTIRDAERKEHPASLGLALSWAPEIFLWIGDLQRAQEHSDWLLSHSESYSLRPYIAVARGYRGSVAVGQGDARTGVEDLRSCLDQLHAMRYRMLCTGFKLSLVQGLVAIGLVGEAMTLINETIRLVEANGDLVYLPEALRVQGGVLLSLPRRRVEEAEMCFDRSLDRSRRQGARSWELRTAIDLARLWAGQGQPERARALLEPIFEEFVEGLDSADLKAAAHMLATLR
jgi:predicted ATPase/DNA-binding winged helix-turn-helix (wHTH) protein